MPSKAELRQKWNEVGDDKVVLHILQRAKTRINGSPFGIKLETYLRSLHGDLQSPYSYYLCQQTSFSRHKSKMYCQARTWIMLRLSLQFLREFNLLMLALLT